MNTLVLLEDQAGNVYGKSGIAQSNRAKSTGFVVGSVTEGTNLMLVNRTGGDGIMVSAISTDGLYYFPGACGAYRIA